MIVEFKPTTAHRTLSKYQAFEAKLGDYEFKGSVDMTKFPHAPRYQPVAARMTLFRDGKFLGKIRARDFDALSGDPIDCVYDTSTANPFGEDQMKGILKLALKQMKVKTRENQ